MTTRLSSTFRNQYDRQPSYGDLERRCRGKVKWAGISIADAFKHQDYCVRIPAQRQLYQTCRKLQAKAAGLAGARVDASFQPKVKAQLAPCYTAYPSSLLAAFAADNPNYRDALMKDPKTVIEKQLNTSLPANLMVKAVQETADTAYVVVPHVPAEGELDDADLEKVAGGLGDKYDARCDRAPGVANTMTVVNL